MKTVASLSLTLSLVLPCSVGHADNDLPLKGTESVAQTSAKRVWCGKHYELHYLTYMQFVRVPGTLTPEEIALVAAFHGARMESAAKTLTAKSCTDRDRNAVVAQSRQDIATWCAHEKSRPGLKARCDEWRAQPE